MRNRRAQMSMMLVALLLGLLLVMQLRTQGRLTKSLAAQSTTDQSTMISNLYDANTALRSQVAKLIGELDQYGGSIGQNDLAPMERELEALSIINGLTDVSGPGIELATNADLRSEDLQDLINEVRNAGAEAISLNGIRITAHSALTQETGNVKLNGIRVNAPYRLVSLGHPDTLERALLRKGGLVTYLQNTYSGATVSVEKQDKLVIPAATVGNVWTYATPTK